MNNLADLIERLESEPYHFVGTVWPAARATNDLPLQMDCHFAREDAAVVVDGKYRPIPGGVQHPFQIRLPFVGARPNVSSAVLSAPPLGSVSGNIFFIAGTLNFLGRTPNSAVSAQVSVSDRGVFTVAGAVEIDSRSFGYYLRGTVSSDRATLSNVVGIAKRNG